MAESVISPEQPTLEGKIDTILSLFTSMDLRFKALENVLGNLAKDVLEIKKEAKVQNEKIEKLQSELSIQKNNNLEIKRQHEYRLMNLEDRQRRKNLRLRGFEKNFGQGGKLVDAIIKWFEGLRVQIDPAEIERAHWSLLRRSPQRQRDIVIAFLSERRAEELYKHLKSISGLNQDGNEIRVLRDLSWQTLQERAALRPISSRLYQSGIKFTWAFPATILIFQDNEIYRARSLEEGKSLLQKLGIDYNQQETQATSDSSGRDTPDDETRQRDEQIKSLERQVAELRKEERSKPRQLRERKAKK